MFEQYPDVFLLLVLAHLIGDFLLQTDRAVAAKRTMRISAFAWHIVLHALLAWLFAGLWAMVVIPAVVGLTHGVIDLAKAGAARLLERFPGTSAVPSLTLFTVDQLLHLLVLFVLAAWLIPWMDPAHYSFWNQVFGAGLAPICLVAIGFIVTVYVGAAVIGMLTQPYLAQVRTAATHAEELIRERGIDRGGRMVGLLERSLVFLLVLTGHLAAVGFVVAAKSVFRFGELRDPAQRRDAEYILIGTLMSFTWALFAAWVTAAVITNDAWRGW